MQNLSKKKNESTPLPGAGSLALAKGVANYGADALGERLVGNVTIKASRPSLLYAR